MRYYEDKDILIREILPSDAKTICEEEIAQGWNQTQEKYLRRIDDHVSKKAIALVAEYNSNVAGYINVYINPTEGSFGGLGHCEIVDFGVLEKYRNKGIGSKLMDVAEEIAFRYSKTVYLGVGLHAGYGNAHRMYIKRGYIPDGKGVWYGNKVAAPYENYCNDDDLVLYLSKDMK